MIIATGTHGSGTATPGAEATPLTVQTRSQPPVPSDRTVSRRRLHEQLDTASGYPLTIVAAGPGWGKSTAVAQWAACERQGLPVAWLTLSSDDDNLASFWNLMIQAILDSGTVPEGHPLHRTSTAAGINQEVLPILHHAMAAVSEPLLLVLDDFHVIEDQQVLNTVHQVVSAGGQVRVMILTRVEPLFPLHRMRLADQVADISAEDLAFRTAETAELARTESLHLCDGELEAVLERTEGWPAGVRLAMLYLARSHDLAHFAGTDRSVAEFLVAEVLERNTVQTRDFLLRTSVAERISSDLAAAVVPEVNGAAVLEMLERTNQFVTALGTERAWFRYHPLLRELLAHTLKRDDPNGFSQAHRATAQWLADHGDPVDALGHAAAAGDWLLFGQIYTHAAAPALVGVRRPAIRKQLEAVPYGELPQSPELQLCIAGLGLVSGQLDSMDQHADSALRLAGHGAELTRATQALLELMTGASARHRGDLTEAARACLSARSIVDAADPFPAADCYRAIAANTRGVALLWIGDTEEARRSLSDALLIAPPADIDITRMTARAHLAMCHLQRADLSRARQLAQSVILDAAAKGWSSMFWLRPAYLALALTHLLRGELDPADAAIIAGLAAREGGSEPAPSLLIHVAQGYAAVSRGRILAASRARDDVLAGMALWEAPAPLREECARMLTDVHLLTGAAVPSTVQDGGRSAARASRRARVMLAAGDARGGRNLADRVAYVAQRENLSDLVASVEAYITMALAADRMGERHIALGHVESALELAREQRLERPFQMAADGVSPLLRSIQACHVRTDPFVTALLGHCHPQPPTTAEPTPLVEHLTGRELAVLSELPTMKSNAEIADEFFVSVNTVKSHLKSLYRKLNVSSRREAVRRAHELNLLR